MKERVLIVCRWLYAEWLVNWGIRLGVLLGTVIAVLATVLKYLDSGVPVPYPHMNRAGDIIVAAIIGMALRPVLLYQFSPEFSLVKLIRLLDSFFSPRDYRGEARELRQQVRRLRRTIKRLRKAINVPDENAGLDKLAEDIALTGSPRLSE